MNRELLYWLQNLVISGREGEEDGGNDEGDEGDDTGNDGEEDQGEDESTGGDSSEDEDDPVKLKERLAKADEALKKERKLRRDAQREARAKKKSGSSDEGEEPEDKDKVKLQKKVSASEEKVQRLATGFRLRAIDSAIEAEARKQGFIDPTDALLDSVRSEIDYEQDEEDPSDVDIDLESVEDAVKDLATRKKHLIGQGQPAKSGTKFRKKGNSDDTGPNLTTLQQEYPSLR